MIAEHMGTQPHFMKNFCHLGFFLLNFTTFSVCTISCCLYFLHDVVNTTDAYIFTYVQLQIRVIKSTYKRTRALNVALSDWGCKYNIYISARVTVCRFFRSEPRAFSQREARKTMLTLRVRSASRWNWLLYLDSRLVFFPSAMSVS